MADKKQPTVEYVFEGEAGGRLKVAHTERVMSCYNFTDSDLDAIGLSHWVAAISFALGASVLTFCLDIKKDILLLTEPTSPSIALDFSVNWFGFPAALAFFVIGVLAAFKRGTVIRRVKKESSSTGVYTLGPSSPNMHTTL